MADKNVVSMTAASHTSDSPIQNTQKGQKGRPALASTQINPNTNIAMLLVAAPLSLHHIVHLNSYCIAVATIILCPRCLAPFEELLCLDDDHVQSCSLVDLASLSQKKNKNQSPAECTGCVECAVAAELSEAVPYKPHVRCSPKHLDRNVLLMRTYRIRRSAGSQRRASFEAHMYNILRILFLDMISPNP